MACRASIRSDNNTDKEAYNSIKSLLQTDQTYLSNLPKLRDLIKTAEEQTRDMTVQVRQLLKLNWSTQHERERELEKNKHKQSKKNDTHRPLPNPLTWIPREIRDVSLAVIGLGQIGAPLCDLLIRSGIRKLVLLDRGTVRPADLVCDLYKPAMVGHSKVQAVQLSLFQLDQTLHLEAYKLDVLNQNDIERLHRNLLGPEYTQKGGKIEKKGGNREGSGGGTDVNDLDKKHKHKNGIDGSVVTALSKTIERYLDIEKRKKIDIMICCCTEKDTRTNVLEVCKSLNIPLVAIRVLPGEQQGTVEFVLPRESRLYEKNVGNGNGTSTGKNKDMKGAGGTKIQPSAGSVASRSRSRNSPVQSKQKEKERNRALGSIMLSQKQVSNKVRPLGLMLSGLGVNEILNIIHNKSVPTFLRYDTISGETSTRLPKKM